MLRRSLRRRCAAGHHETLLQQAFRTAERAASLAVRLQLKYELNGRMLRPQSAGLTRARSLLAEQLPLRSRWLVRDTTVDFDFTRSRSYLRALTPDDFNGELKTEWAELFLFGQQDVAQGGGSSSLLGISLRSGEVFGLDVERGTPLYFLSSSVTPLWLHSANLIAIYQVTRMLAAHG